MDQERSSGRIICADCRYAKVDREASEGNWTAYECANSQSDYHHALLNITYGGSRLDEIVWSGCDKAVRW